jgi:hypothetical protein
VPQFDLDSALSSDPACIDYAIGLATKRIIPFRPTRSRPCSPSYTHPNRTSQPYRAPRPASSDKVRGQLAELARCLDGLDRKLFFFFSFFFFLFFFHAPLPLILTCEALLYTASLHIYNRTCPENEQGRPERGVQGEIEYLELGLVLGSNDGVDGLCEALDVRLVEASHGNSTVR